MICPIKNSQECRTDCAWCIETWKYETRDRGERRDYQCAIALIPISMERGNDNWDWRALCFSVYDEETNNEQDE